MYRLPPTPLSTFITTSATPAAFVTTSLVAAPGAGKRFRIAWLEIVARVAIAAGVHVHCQFSSAGGIFIPLALSDTMPTAKILFPEPGLLDSSVSNAALQVAHAASVASELFYLSIGYFVELV